MFCVNCGADIVGGGPFPFPKNCPACGHKTVTRPKLSGLADRQIKLAFDRVSAEGKVHFLRDHVAWELMRVLGRRATLWRTLSVSAAAGVAFGIGITLLVTGHTLIGMSGLLGAVIILLFSSLRSLNRLDYNGLLELVDEFETVNPAPLMIKPDCEYADGGDVGGQPDPLATGRLLVCDRQLYVDFFRANDFEMHAACAVVLGAARPSEEGRKIIAHMKRMSDVKVFLVHDFTPNGVALADRVRESSRWFAGCANVTVHDLGIIDAQQDMLGAQLRPLTSIPQSGDVGIPIMAFLRGGLGSELSVFRPQRLLNMTWQSIEQCRPFHEVDPRKARDDGWVGGGG